MMVLGLQKHRSHNCKTSTFRCQDNSACPELLYYVTREQMGKIGGVINAPIRLDQNRSEDIKVVLRKASENRAYHDDSLASQDNKHNMSDLLQWALRRKM